MNRLNAFPFVFLAFSAILLISVLPVKASGDLWVERVPVPNAEFNFGAVSVSGEIYAIGHNFTYIFDPAPDTWVSKTPMPSHRQGFATAACQNKIYVIGGWNSTDPHTGIAITMSINEMYDPATDTWATKASLPTPTANMEASVIDDKIYVISGMSDISKPTLSSFNWVYDPSRNSWSAAAPIPTSVFNYASAVISNKICVEGGGLSGSPYYCNLNQIYDPKTNTWTLGEPLLVMVHNGVAGATTGVLATAKLYVIGGTNDGINGVDTVQIYDSQTGNWTLGAQMPTARLGLAVAVLNDTLYALGGLSSAGPQNNKGTIYAVNEQYLPIDYQGPMPSPYIPTPSPPSTSTPTLTPSPTNFGPTSSPTPLPSIPEFPSWTIPLLFSMVVAAGLSVYFKKLKS